jgi:hypothetical protein
MTDALRTAWIFTRIIVLNALFGAAAGAAISFAALWLTVTL